LEEETTKFSNALALASGGLSLVMLFVWQLVVPFSDWGILFVLPFALVLFLGSLQANAAVYRARVRIALRSDSPYARFLTGQLRAWIHSVLFAAIATFLLAAFAMSAAPAEWAVLSLIIFSSQFMFSRTDRHFNHHLTAPFARIGALWITTVSIGLFYLPILAWVNWAVVPRPDAITDMSMTQALQMAFDQLPRRQGFVSELLAPFYALDYLKLWIAVHSSSKKLIGFVFCIDAGLVALIAARAGAVLTSFIRSAPRAADEKTG